MKQDKQTLYRNHPLKKMVNAECAHYEMGTPVLVHAGANLCRIQAKVVS